MLTKHLLTAAPVTSRFWSSTLLIERSQTRRQLPSHLQVSNLLATKQSQGCFWSTTVTASNNFYPGFKHFSPDEKEENAPVQMF